MKLSSCGFLLTSSLLSTCLIFADAASPTPKATTDLSTGFDGSSQEFTSKTSNDSNETTYNVTADISFENISTITASQPPPPPPPAGNKSVTEGCCFSNTAGDLIFTGNSHSLSFKNISLTGKGAAISNTADTKTTTLSGFSHLTFSSSPSSTVATGKGAIFCQGSSLNISNNTLVSFTDNHSTENGGAIGYETTPTPPTPPPTPPSSPNPSPQATHLSSVSSGTPVQSAQATVTFQGNTEVLFSGNSSGKNGGAIYAQNLAITSSSGTILFTNNTAKEKGGAIAIANSGTLSLSAEGGNIIFQGNIAKDGSNAIDLGTSAKITQLRATQGSSIYFYDPITGNGANVTDKLVINNPDTISGGGGSSGPGGAIRSSAAQPSPKTYTGTVVFSGKNNNTKALTNVTSLTQPVELAAGTLVLEDGALFDTKSFTQKDDTSKVLLEQNSQLQASENIDLKNLWVGVSDPTTKRVAGVSTSGSGSITISGPITLALSDPKFYENPDLAKDLNQEFIKIAAAKGTITLNNQSDPVQQDIGDHLGYQGVWKLTWADSPSGKEKVATLDWKPQGYIPPSGDTHSQTSLVPNSLWVMAFDVAAIQRLIEEEAKSATGGDIWGAGLSNFLQGKKTDKNRKFRNISSGYAAGISSKSLHDFKFSFSFSQLFGRAKDYAGARIHEKILSGSLYAQYDTKLLPILKFLSGTSVFRPSFLTQVSEDFPISFQAQFGYFYGDNTMKIKYPDTTQANSSWENHCCSGDIGASITIPMQSKDGLIQKASPFAKLQSIYVYQKGFQEKGLRRRAFDHTYLINISIPLGFKVHGESSSKDLYYEVSAAYVGDVYRHNPQNTTTPIVAGVVATPWLTTATYLQRHAARFQGSGSYALTSYIHLFAQGSVELRKLASSYHANAGSSIHF